MTARPYFRIASVTLVLFAAAHTYGFLKFVPPTREGAAVLEAMRTVVFPIGSQTFTYETFYRGFGLSVSIYLLFAAALAWMCGSLAGPQPRIAFRLGVALFVTQLANGAIGVLHFALIPTISCFVVIALVGFATWLCLMSARRS